MSVKKVPIRASFGRVRIVTEKGTEKAVTVECFEARMAVLFAAKLEAEIREGDWVSVSGMAVMEVSHRKGEEEVLRIDPYWRAPYGSGDLQGWPFYMLRDPEWRSVGADGVPSAIQRTTELLTPVLDGTASPEQVEEAALAARELHASLLALAEEKKIPKVKITAVTLEDLETTQS